MRSRKALPVRSSGSRIWVSFHSFPAKKMQSSTDNGKAYHKLYELSSFKGSSSSDEEPHDAHYKIPCLIDELETLILARLPRSEHWKLSFINKRFLALSKSGEIYKIRREIGLKEPSVFMFASGESNWWAFDGHFKSSRKLPIVPSDEIFGCLDKESFCAGTHLFVSGKELKGAVLWRYESAANKWFKGPSMITSRCLFASASSGDCAYIAGGIDMETSMAVLNSVEKYSSDTKCWETLPAMKRRRRACSGCYMDNKFYVIGGQDEQHNHLSCAEFFDEEAKTWTLIPDMLKDIPVSTSQSPPLVAVAKNQLYTLDASSNELKFYLKGDNLWKKLGPVPVRADVQRGWGVAFKSLGNELLVIGATTASSGRRGGMTIYTCCPDPAVEELQWKQIECGINQLNHFIHNCAVMMA